MKNLHKSQLFAAYLGSCMAFAPMLATAEDIDIFTGSSAGSAANPNILIVLDNSANWSKASQKWEPQGTVQGQAEVNAINTVINSLGASGPNVNIGLMEYAQSGSLPFGGYIRFAVKPMNSANITSFGTQLNTIYNNINDPAEKVSMTNNYGDLMFDAYNYFAGLAPVTPDSVGVNPDPDGYTSAYTQFATPVSAAEACARNFVIFIGNPAQGGPGSDTATNSCDLAALNGSTCPSDKFSPQLGLPDFTSTTTTGTTTLGTTAQCYSAADVSAKNSAISACLTAQLSDCYATHVDASYLKSDGSAGNSATDCSSYTSNCAIGTTAIANTCAAGELRYSVIQTVSGGSTVTSSAPTTSCYAAPEDVVPDFDHGTLSCPADAVCTYETGAVASVCTAPPVTSSASTTSCYASAGAVDPATDHGTLTCPAGHTCTYTTGASTSNCTSATSTSLTTSCYSGINTGNNKWTNSSPQDVGTLVCPPDAVCSYSGATPTSSAGCASGDHYTVTQTVVMKKYSVTQTATPIPTGNHYTITQSAVTSSATTTNLGYTAACYASPPASTADYAASCSGAGISCTYGNTPTTSTLESSCASGNKYPVIATDVVTTNTPTGTTTIDTNVFNADEWARFMFQKGVPVSGGTNAKVNTYTIDVHKAQPEAVHTSLYLNMAKFGGGKYFKAGSEAEITAALTKILAEIQSVNSTFASASLPVNSTNRAQNANQVFIGMFRPDPNAAPRWFGNLKQYQIGSDGTTLDLYDNASPAKPAINVLTGFLDDCAQSFWTTDSPTTATVALPWISSHYWGNIASEAPVSLCPTSPYNIFSDIPDGPFVEKGAVAEVLRKGNDPAASPTWSFNRNMYTLSGGALAAYAVGNSGLASTAFNFTQGKDVTNESSLTNWTVNTNVMRHTVHGDVIHSRPLPVNYGTSANANAGVTVFYGANDGTYRAVVATGSNAGKELWSFVAPEFSSIAASRNTSSGSDPLTRLMNNTPPVSYPVTPAVAGGIPKDYFFDGSTGIYQNEDNSQVWIYPGMRRGGRMIYAFDVTNSSPGSATSPKFTFKWRAGCPNLKDDTGCADGTGGETADMASMGQTWSTPGLAFARGYSMTTPVVVVGGGYDDCEDADLAAPACAGGKGHAIYVFDGNTGALLRKLTDASMRSVIADIAFIDPNNNGDVDYAYAVDTGGNIYRINFYDPATNAYLDEDHWTIKRVAYTSSGSRKFQWTPGLLPISGGKVYVALASGDREHPLQSHYPYTSGITNRLYVYLDDPTDAAAAAVDLDGADMSDFTSPTTCATPGIYPGSSNTNKGWFMDFSAAGEQAVTSAVIAGGMATVSTNLPIPPAAGTCATSLGEARGYWVNLFNASGAMGVEGTCGSNDRYGVFAGGGLPPSPVFGTVPIGDENTPTTVLIGAIQREGGASSPIAPQLLQPSVQSIRKLRYWKNSGDN